MLKRSGCYIIRQGINHTIWFSPLTNSQFAVPRHKGEIKTGTANNILKGAGVK
ncbi:MAG: type II toxin-antitoxin system HicA family toxin [Lachnospiraceae bacterium]|nr:type II toxin-antitoxin system HicA family toxin [Lachnospiraceae bacterium]